MLKIEPLSQDHDREGFDCGVPALNQFFRHQAGQAQKKGISRTFVAVEEDAVPPKSVIGFFSVVATEALTSSLPLELARKFPAKIPAVILARLAVDSRRQGRGIGGALLAEALAHIHRLAQHLGIAGAFVDAKDETAAAFYRKFGFVPLPSDPLRLFMPLSRIHSLVTSR